MYNAQIESIKAKIEELESIVPVEVDYKQEIISLHGCINMINDPNVSAKAKMNSCAPLLIGSMLIPLILVQEKDAQEF